MITDTEIENRSTVKSNIVSYLNEFKMQVIPNTTCEEIAETMLKMVEKNNPRIYADLIA